MDDLTLPGRQWNPGLHRHTGRQVLYERYFNGARPDSSHLLFRPNLSFPRWPESLSPKERSREWRTRSPDICPAAARDPAFPKSLSVIC
jgi:hypothetical protein